MVGPGDWRRPDEPGSALDAALADLRDESDAPGSATLDDVRRVARDQDLSWLEAMWLERLAIAEGLVGTEVPPPLPWYQPSQELHSFAAWVRSAHRYQLLQPEEVVRFAQEYEAGREAAEALNPDDPPTAETRRLGVLVWRGLLAREFLVCGNLRLVRTIAARYRTDGVEPVDLMQAGVLGLLRAVELFDWRLGWKLSTYATHWIRQSIGRELDNRARMIRFPVHVEDALRRIERERRRLRESLHREPTASEMAPLSDLDLEEVQRLEVLREVVPLDEVRAVDESGGEWRDRSEWDRPVEDEGILGATVLELRRALTTLDPRLQEVLRLRFGLDGGEEFSLREAGKVLGLSGERVRLLQRDAFGLLRSFKRLGSPLG